MSQSVRDRGITLVRQQTVQTPAVSGRTMRWKKRSDTWSAA